MSYRLFLDDHREPKSTANFVYPVDLRPEYRLHDWVIVRSYPEFVKTIEVMGIPTHVSFDHDLYPHVFEKNLVDDQVDYYAKDFKDPVKKTGYHCAKWLIKYAAKCKKPMPVCYVHSNNQQGRENIKSILKLNI